MANSPGTGGKSAARLKKRNETKMILRQPVLLIAVLATIALLVLFVIFPLAKVLLFSVTDESGAVSLASLKQLFTTTRYLKTFGRTMALGVVVAVISTFIGYIFAFTITRTNVPCKGFLKTIATLPILSPPFILSLSIIFLFGKQGLITKELLGITGNNVYGMGSLVVVQVISFFPIAYMTLSGILSSIDASVEDAACNMGASRWHTFWTVTFPLSLPGIISGCLLVFIQSLEDFSNPATIGGDFTTLSVEVYQIINGSYDMRKGSALALLMLVPAMVAFLLNKYWVNKKSFVTVTGKPTQARKLMDEAHIKWPLFIFCMLVAAVIILFYGTVVFGSFVQTWGYNYSLTLDQYSRALQQGWDSLKNSMILGLVAALLGGLLGMVIAYITAKRNYYGKRFIEVSSVLMFAVPGTVLGIAYILAFNTGFLVLTGTAAILVIVFVFRNMPVAIESGTTTLLQIDNSIEEASTILGAGSGYSFRRITLPMLRNAFFSGIVYSFVKAITAVSAVIFLVSPRWNLVTSKIYTLFDQAKYSQAAAFVTMMVVILLVFIGIFNGLINLLLAPRSRVPKGVGANPEKTEETK
ncbi:ABC transporter permease [Dysosmobacter sp.]|uniref:ABC transporter permease n=1 Tax=Dysosmobacter sp. TaxID=2591382 RepID=UPI001BB471A6|nr:iron ABC transporter permease [Dysosmobacter sp.]MCI6053623.1 iron ABC transporter permease [Dysosmobacter sp.]MDY5511044.1 iron ABC transporter permease [Dysosmobacter sp.]QUO36939.1 iron ABC transporter permease [Dysosmobacter sp. Marseille-Q4140]